MAADDVAAALPTPPALTTVYIVRIDMSGGSNGEHETIDDVTEKTTFTFDGATRRRIGQVRSSFRARIEKECVHFYGLLITKQDKLDQFSRLAAESDVALKAIHSSLHGRVSFIMLRADQQAEGEVYHAMVNAIRGQIFKTLNERLEDLAKLPSLPTRSRIALLKLCDQMDQWNVLEDPDIRQTIADYRLQFEHDVIAPVAAEVKQQFDALTSIGAYVEMED